MKQVSLEQREQLDELSWFGRMMHNLRLPVHNHWFNLLVIVYLAFILDVTGSAIRFDYYYRFLPLIVIVPFGLKDMWEIWKIHKIRERLLETIWLFAFPVLIPTLIALITAPLIYHDSSLCISSFGRCCFYLFALFGAYYLVRSYGKRFVNLILIAGTLSYLTVIIRFFMDGGTDLFGWSPHEITLEVNQLTYIYSFLFLYYLLAKRITRKWRFIGLSLTIIGIVLGNKRALYLALALALSCYYLFHKILKVRKRGFHWIAGLLIALAFVWIFVIQSGLLQQLFVLLGINDMSRFKMWNLFQQDYSVQPFYFGRGVTYTDVALVENRGYLMFSHAITLHNDILRLYIGWGFMPMLYFLFMFIYDRTAVFLKKEHKAHNGWIFFAITIVFYIINFFGNTLLDTGCTTTIFAVWYVLYYEKQSVKSKKAAYISTGKDKVYEYGM